MKIDIDYTLMVESHLPPYLGSLYARVSRIKQSAWRVTFHFL